MKKYLSHTLDPVEEIAAYLGGALPAVLWKTLSSMVVVPLKPPNTTGAL